MSVNIYDGTTLTPIAGKTVPMPTPDYVDEQYNNSTTYSKGMTCISGNKRYRYINSTASSGHQPPNATYWEVLSVSDQLGEGGEWTLVDYSSSSHYGDHYTVNGHDYRRYVTKATANLSQYKYLAVVLKSGSMVMCTCICPTTFFNLNPSGTTNYMAQNHISERYRFTFGHVSNLYYIDAGSTSTTDTTMRTELYGIK